MRTQTWTALFLVAAAPAVLAGNVTVYGSDDLSAEATATFLDCLGNLTAKYRVYVDEGVTVVLPAGANQTIDLDGADEGLYDCMTLPSVISTLQIATEDTVEDDENHSTAVHVSKASHAWLVGKGALGQKPVGTQPAGNNTLAVRGMDLDDENHDHSGLTKRVHHYYFAFLSDYLDCTNNALRTVYGSTCYNYSQAWYSTRFENAFSKKILTMKVWPHHNCKKGNERKFHVAPNSISSCLKRTTFSYHGHYKTCSC